MAEKTPPTPGSLEALGIEADNLGDTSAPGAGSAEPEAAPGLTNEQIICSAIAGAREVFCHVSTLASPRATLDDAKVESIAKVLGPVLVKYQVNLVDSIGAWTVELAAAGVLIQIGLGVRAGVMAELAAREATPPADTAHTVENAA